MDKVDPVVLYGLISKRVWADIGTFICQRELMGILSLETLGDLLQLFPLEPTDDSSPSLRDARLYYNALSSCSSINGQIDQQRDDTSTHKADLIMKSTHFFKTPQSNGTM
jgi:hypothetical protein